MHTLDSDSSLKLQHTLTKQQLSEQRLKALYDKLDPPSKRIVDSAMEKHAGAWLKAIPTVPELSISSDKMVIALRGYSSGNSISERSKGVSHLQEKD